MASRSVASEEMNSVLEIPYPPDEDRLQDPAPLEVSEGIQASEPEKQRPWPALRLHGRQLDPRESAGFAPRMVEISANGGLHGDAMVCSSGGDRPLKRDRSCEASQLRHTDPTRAE